MSKCVTGVETINGRSGLRIAVWSQVRVSGCRLGLWPIGLYAVLYVTTAPLQLQYAAYSSMYVICLCLYMYSYTYADPIEH